ncbi:unnamed protein product [Nippostrongylus brasiliensis]|uniref:acireductone dioxygenase (Fe(2+)-requiring) n=1 Tax=Nippostrongylus brasiliensis TaxID=27835 RepID=A0A0N4XIZ2_NIPBR|nr:unnamed protein product [Nippostrongylus brasiliensis]
MSLGAYFMGPVVDQREHCRLTPNREATSADLAKIGVETEKIDMTADWESQLDKLAATFDMHSRDEIHISRETMPDFDKKDDWIRIPVQCGDFLFLPAGIYHRFTTDKNDDITAVRLFRSSPRWEALPRSSETESLEERKEFVELVKKRTE